MSRNEGKLFSHNRTRSSHQLNSLVDRMNRIDSALKQIKDDEDTQRNTLAELLKKSQQLEEKSKNSLIRCNNIRSKLQFSNGDSSQKDLSICGENPQKQSPEQQQRFEAPRNLQLERTYSERQFHTRVEIKFPLTPGHTDKQLKKISFFQKSRRLEELDQMISKALVDLKVEKTSKPLRTSVSFQNSTILKRKDKKDKTNKISFEPQVIVILVLLVITLLVIYLI